LAVWLARWSRQMLLVPRDNGLLLGFLIGQLWNGRVSPRCSAIGAAPNSAMAAGPAFLSPPPLPAPRIDLRFASCGRRDSWLIRFWLEFQLVQGGPYAAGSRRSSPAFINGVSRGSVRGSRGPPLKTSPNRASAQTRSVKRQVTSTLAHSQERRYRPHPRPRGAHGGVGSRFRGPEFDHGFSAVIDPHVPVSSRDGDEVPARGVAHRG